jgi:4-alpha-glucanotransferase
MSAVEALARRCGIALTRPDAARERERSVSRESLHAILAALGFDAATDERAAEALAELDRRAWEAALPAVVVARERAVTVDVTLPSATRLLSWHVRCEDGRERTGEASFAELPLRERAPWDEQPGRRKERRRLALGDVPRGYHRLELSPHGASTTLVVTPQRCFLPAVDERGGGLAGLALQLYLLRSERNFGIGDFGDLAALGTDLARRRCDVVGLNPLHAPFPDDPEHASPYSPASRLLLNPLYIDLTAAPPIRESPGAAAMLADPALAAEAAACRAGDTLEYARVAALKTRVLDRAFADWRSAAEPSGLHAFRAAQGASFERHCLYFALRAHLIASGQAPGDWHHWPQAYQEPRSPAVADFARTHADDVTRVAWQQWLADRQLASAAEAAQRMRVGLYRDLAVGSDAAGAETWAERDLVVEALAVGAPPDPFSATGQEWGLPPLNPERLRASGYRPFVELLRANMRHAGALRIDHVMALERLYVIPKGAPPSAGAYLDYPREDLLGIVALESERGRVVIVGEDLGVVPPGFRERLAAANVLSYRVLRWQRDGRRFLRPAEYPRLAVAVVGNHDLSTLRAWWEGADLAREGEHRSSPEAELDAALADRQADRDALLEVLHDEGLLPAWVAAPSYEQLFGAVHELLGRTRALLTLTQLDDVLRELEPVNRPGAPSNRSWRRRYSKSVEQLADEPLLDAAMPASRAPHEAVAARTFS